MFDILYATCPCSTLPKRRHSSSLLFNSYQPNKRGTKKGIDKKSLTVTPVKKLSDKSQGAAKLRSHRPTLSSSSSLSAIADMISATDAMDIQDEEPAKKELADGPRKASSPPRKVRPNAVESLAAVDTRDLVQLARAVTRDAQSLGEEPVLSPPVSQPDETADSNRNLQSPDGNKVYVDVALQVEFPIFGESLLEPMRLPANANASVTPAKATTPVSSFDPEAVNTSAANKSRGPRSVERETGVSVSRRTPSPSISAGERPAWNKSVSTAPQSVIPAPATRKSVSLSPERRAADVTPTQSSVTTAALTGEKKSENIPFASESPKAAKLRHKLAEAARRREQAQALLLQQQQQQQHDSSALSSTVDQPHMKQIFNGLIRQRVVEVPSSSVPGAAPHASPTPAQRRSSLQGNIRSQDESNQRTRSPRSVRFCVVCRQAIASPDTSSAVSGKAGQRMPSPLPLPHSSQDVNGKPDTSSTNGRLGVKRDSSASRRSASPSISASSKTCFSCHQTMPVASDRSSLSASARSQSPSASSDKPKASSSRRPSPASSSLTAALTSSTVLESARATAIAFAPNTSTTATARSRSSAAGRAATEAAVVTSAAPSASPLAGHTAASSSSTGTATAASKRAPASKSQTSISGAATPQDLSSKRYDAAVYVVITYLYNQSRTINYTHCYPPICLQT